MNTIIKPILALTIIPFLTSCELDSVFENIITTENGVQVCRKGIPTGAENSSMLGGYLCPDPFEYREQINNSSPDRFNVNTYSIDVNTSGNIEGKWLVFDSVSFNNNTSTKTKYREVCDLILQEGTTENYNLTCLKLSSQEMKYLSGSSSVEVSTTVREGEIEGDKFTRTSVVSGIVTDFNRIDFNRTITIEYESGEVIEKSDTLYSMIRLGDVNNTLGSISIIKNDYNGQLLLQRDYIVSYIIEGEATNENISTVEYYAEDKSLLGVKKNYINMPSQGIHEEQDNVSYEAGGFSYLYDDVAALGYLRYRQYDYNRNDSFFMDIDFIVTRIQSERFKTDTIIGNIFLSF